MDFILMLTRDDRTIVDPLEVISIALSQGIRHIGCKDIGASPESLRKIAERIRSEGGTSYLEVVSTTVEDCVVSARNCVAAGFDRLLGGTDAQRILQCLKGSRIEYYPFPGTPLGHPTVLGGKPEDIARDCRIFERKGCAGVDLLAYRARDADPIELVRAARASMRGRLICAGSVDRPARIRALAEAGCDAFTIGSAIFNGSFEPRTGSTASQLQEVLRCL